MEKKDISIPTVLYPEVVQPPTEKGKETSVKKVAVVSVAALTALALILGSVLLAIHLVAEKDDSYYAREKTISAKDEKGAKTQEKMYVNTKTKEETFETSKISVVHDFNKGLTVIKTLGSNDKYVCYLTTLNSTGMINPAEMEKALSSDEITSPNDNEEQQKEDEKFQQTDVKVTNREFLSPKSKAMCEGYSIYWMIPTGSDVKDGAERQKRGLCIRYRCYLFLIRVNGRFYYRYRCYYYYYNC